MCEDTIFISPGVSFKNYLTSPLKVSSCKLKTEFHFAVLSGLS